MRPSRCLVAWAACAALLSLPAVGGEAAARSAGTRALRDGEIPAARMERKARKIGRRLLRKHLPHGTVFDPVFASPESGRVVGYTRAGDSAIWTGHLLAAESFRYAVTGDPGALASARALVQALTGLVDVTGNEALARAAIPADSRWADAITVGEAHQGVHPGTIGGVDHVWSGNTSRDQYSGVMFGLAFAFELLDDEGLRAEIRVLVGRLLDNLLAKNWTVVLPDGSLPTTFLGRPDQQLAFLQIGVLVDPERFVDPYRSLRTSLGTVAYLPIAIEATDPHGSYFKFNLDAINLVHLVRLESSLFYQGQYGKAYRILRDTVEEHGNAHFNMIDRVVMGPDPARDAETIELLLEWLRRPRRDEWVDWRGARAACGGDRACEAIAVRQRPSTDFLWQRSPFLLYGGGAGTVEGAGIDYLLPYWMARYYGLL